MASDTVLTHFDNFEEFEEVLDQAETNAKTGREQEFVEQTRERWDGYGHAMKFSEAQANWLKGIAKVN